MSEAVEMVYECELFGKTFRVYGTVENPLFLAKDVAEWIEYTKTGKGAYNISMMLQSVDDDEKLMSTILVSGQNREMWFLREQGLYELLMQSRKPIAKQFKSKVKAILKEIRLTGQYSSLKKSSQVDETIPIPDFNNPLEAMKSWIKVVEENKILKQNLIEYDKKYQSLADLNWYSNRNIDVSAFASYVVSTDNFKVSRNKIYKWFRERGYIQKISDNDQIPYQQYIDEGLFEVVEYSCKTGYTFRVVHKILITPKGQVFFTNAIRKDYFGIRNLVTVHSTHA